MSAKIQHRAKFTRSLVFSETDKSSMATHLRWNWCR